MIIELKLTPGTLEDSEALLEVLREFDVEELGASRLPSSRRYELDACMYHDFVARCEGLDVVESVRFISRFYAQKIHDQSA